MLPNLADQFAALWESSNRPPDVFAFLERHADSEAAQKLAVLLLDQQERWKTSEPLPVESYLGRIPDLASDPKIKLQLAVGEFQARRNGDSSPRLDEFLMRFADLGDTLRGKLSALDSGCLEEGQPKSFGTTQTFASTVASERIGRYRLIRVLGEGAFGRVCLGFDEELQRQVAIKVPKPERFQQPEDAETYLAEARMVARLDHPYIVPVHDVGRTDEGSIYFVSKFIEGRTLETRIKEDRPTPEESARLLATIAGALHYAHQKQLIHRDVKPGNILLEDATGRAYIADFGLAIREEDYLREGRIAGTPAYMSPEQARGEGHRLDGRSDIFSLGVVLYELLTGKRPFRGSTPNELLHQVVSVEPAPPRELSGSIPLELERICLKALSKRASDRYASAAELADDLLHWQQGPRQDRQERSIVPKGLRSFDAADADFFLDLLPGPRDREGLPESIRFWKTRLEETDRDQAFSVGLIYGPSGCGKSSLVKAGLLPRLSQEVLAVHVEATADDTETRILCGLRKQLPDLPDDLGLVETFALLRRTAGRKVVIVLDQFEQWLHAHRAEQETNLVSALRQCDGGRLQAVVMVRDDFWLAVSRFMKATEVEILEGRNSALVDLFDPFHARKVLAAFGRAYGRLPDSLGHCSKEQDAFLDRAVAELAQEGKVISVRLALFAEMVKGKPWTSATLAEVGGTEGIGVNFLEETFVSRSANPNHRLHQAAAREVLGALLPEVGTDIKGRMRSHLELMNAAGYQNRPSDFNDLLRILDGEIRLVTPTDPEGFQTVSGSDPSSKYYQLTHDYLVPSLRHWLTRKQRETRKGRAEIRLAERAAGWNSLRENKQLPTLWEWLAIGTLTDRQRWAAPQRAVMHCASRFHLSRLAIAAMLLGILAFAGVWTWQRVDRNRRALLAEAAQEQEATRIEGLVGRLQSAEPAQIPEIVKELDANPEAATTYLSPLVSSNASTLDEKRSQLHARLAAVARDKSLVEPLLEELLTNKVAYIGPIRQQLRPYAGELTEKLWAILRDENAEAKRRFHAALALADYVPDSEAASWTDQDLKFVAQQLVSANAEFQPLLREYLRSIGGRLLADLETIFADAKATDAQRLSAANAFADYAATDIPKLSQLLAAATPEQYAVLYPIVAASPAPDTIEYLGKIAATLPPAELGSVERVPYGQRRANAAVTLLRLGEREKVLPVFEMTDDPEALTQFIFRCHARGVSVDALLDCLRIVSDGPVDRYPRSARYALLLALGEYTLEEIPESRREALLKQLADWYRQDPSSGIHGAAGWLLRQWGQTDIAREVDQTPVPYAPDREWFTLAITVTPTAPPKPQEEPAENKTGTESQAQPDRPTDDAESQEQDTEKQDKPGGPAPPPEQTKSEPPPPQTFYYTFMLFPAGDYEIGSVNGEPDRQNDEVRHHVKLTRPYALLDREIAWEELIAFSPKFARFMRISEAKPADAGFGVDWYDSVGFCRWLGQQSGLSEGDQSYAAPEALDPAQYPREPNPEANWAPRNWPLELGRRGFRLPTESEWEVASRAGARTTYGYGSDVGLLDRFGWFSENSGKHVHPPRELRPSVRGLFDMHGTLNEWSHDWYDDYGGDEAIADPLGAQEGLLRVSRGGSWPNDSANCRSSLRRPNDPTNRSIDLGFRLALSPSGVAPEAGPVKRAEPAGGGTEGASAEQRPEMP